MAPLTRPEYNALRRLAGHAFDELGGQPEPARRTLRDYDHERFGPYLGVSGEASAAPAIREAALGSPKVRALGLTEPIEVGVAHDAERLGSVGELPVGPDEYRDIRLECLGRILTSTNVGARLNVRYYGRVPAVWVNPGRLPALLERTCASFRDRIAPFLETPDRQPRPAIVFVQFRAKVPRGVRHTMLRTLVRRLACGEIGNPAVHSVGLLAKVRRGRRGLSDARVAIDLARRIGVRTVAVEGAVRYAAEDFVSMPSLLQYFNPAETSVLLEYALRRGVELRPKNIIDTKTVAREVWAALAAARRAGTELGKYGLFPLTVEESERVITSVQRWFPSWSAAPVFYVDVPVVSGSRVFTRRGVPAAIEEWLRMVARHRVPVVLIDTVDKGKGFRLMKQGPRDARGILSADEIQVLDRLARSIGVRALWAGGITLPQAFEFGRLGVFGIYVTTAATVARPVSAAHADDVALAAERLPTWEGVARVKLLLEAGCLVKRLAERKLQAESAEIEGAAGAFLTVSGSGGGRRHQKARAAGRKLDALVFKAWKLLGDGNRQRPCR